MKDKYYLGNNIFKLQIEQGLLKSIKGIRDSLNVEYINEERGFGNLYLTFQKNGEEKQCRPFELVNYKENEPVKTGEKLSYTGTVLEEELLINNTYILENNYIKQQITITNQSDQKICIKDFGISFSPHTKFEWGKNAGQEVIGKHFVSGHGSHSTYYRCDGQGKILLAIPGAGSSFIYYEGLEAEGKEVQDKSTMILYSLNDSIGKIVAKQGARLRMDPIGKELLFHEMYQFSIQYFLTEDYEDCKDTLVKQNHVVAESIPGYTIPLDLEVKLCLRSTASNLEIIAPENVAVDFLGKKGENFFYAIRFEKLGEQTICVKYDDGIMHLYYFVTQSIETMLAKRGAFIASKQVKEERWYRGLFAEWNNETKVLLTPDNYDFIKGWRRYEVTCDDPGLSKPAFLSMKQTVAPVQEEVEGLDYYIEHFVWGGLQQTESEPYPYAIYGIPDWNVLRNSDKLGNDGRTHLWRIYDYPHIALMYYNMYKVASEYPFIHTKLSKQEYLQRAYGTALAMFCIPEELTGWSALKTGLYNECVIPEIIKALEKNGEITKSLRLQNLWRRKILYFVMECKDVFGSEYPFDTTGFESTYYLADEAIKQANYSHNDSPWSEEIEYVNSLEFMENQMSCNVACRGMLEPSYFWYGSDYRGNNTHYLLSYMSQMGGGALLNYVCYYAKNPFALLRLAYGSMLSSWALLNSGEEESNYGYWFPGKENDGCAAGGFEALYSGTTWLEQPHHGGAWYYSCEIDLGFCGGIRNAATIIAEDPLFGRICYGGKMVEHSHSFSVTLLDGVRKRFHYIGANDRIHIQLEGGQIWKENGCTIEMREGRIQRMIIRLINFYNPGSIKITTNNMCDFKTNVEGILVKSECETQIKVDSPINELILEAVN